MMAAKILKHLGIGGKKAPPHPPKPDYGTQKSTSVQELLPKSPTRDRSTMSLSTAGAHLGEYDNASLTDSPHHRLQAGSKSLSPKGGRTDSLASTSTMDEVEGAEAGGAGKKAPQLLDEYSDPFDLKKQLSENPELLGACAAPVTDDDYSVPYEVKKLIKEMKLREGGESRGSPRKGPHLYDDPYEEGPGKFSPSKGAAYSTESQDLRPREDYDEPWEWSAKQNVFLQQMESMANQNSTPLMTPKRTVNAEGKVTPAESSLADNGVSDDMDEHSKDYEKSVQNAGVGEEEEDGYAHLHEDLSDELVETVDAEAAVSAPAPTANQKKANDTRVGNYEEPWDLSSTQKELEDKLMAVASDRASRVRDMDKERDGSGKERESSAGAPAGPPPHESDTRPQEGYEKPWDWKPHKKDDRPQEGYEKPWDWKPHQRDDRPPEEYEEPWDEKAKQLERDLIQAKSAKESPTAGSSAAKDGAAAAAPALAAAGGNKEDDTRPSEEYEEPWDQKLKNKTSALARSGMDGNRASHQSSSQPSPTSSPSSSVPLPPGAQGQSPKKKHKLNLELGCSAWNSLGERIDPKVPLEEQGWYHGSISRVDAENRLRVHKEGSYLVRMSESNRLDYSLSLRSAKGFMHMKIVNRNGRFILGQFSQPFDTIPAMIHHYSVNKLPIRGAEHMSLLHPIIHEFL